MIIERSMHDGWLSNTWLIADEPGGHGVLVDTGGPPEPVVEKVDELDVTITHLLCTHHHYDHVANNDRYRELWGAPVCGHPAEERLFARGLDQRLEDGAEVQSGTLRIRALLIPGHTCGQLAYLVNDTHVCTGDTLFASSIGGTRGPGHTTFEDIRHSIMDVLMALPPDTRVLPGHMEETTVGAEWERNPFIRIWRGLDAPAESPCRALGEPATLMLRAPDYDGGTKCWVRFAGGADDIVPGSRVSAQ